MPCPLCLYLFLPTEARLVFLSCLIFLFLAAVLYAGKVLRMKNFYGWHVDTAEMDAYRQLEKGRHFFHFQTVPILPIVLSTVALSSKQENPWQNKTQAIPKK